MSKTNTVAVNVYPVCYKR